MCQRKFTADFAKALILTASQNTFVKYQWEGSQQKMSSVSNTNVLLLVELDKAKNTAF